MSPSLPTSAYLEWPVFLLLCGLTLTAWCDGLWTNAVVVTVVTGLCLIRRLRRRGSGQETDSRLAGIAWCLVGIPVWGLAQVWLHLTVYEYETLSAVTRWCGYAGIFWLCSQSFGAERRIWLDRFVGFASAMGTLSLLERFTSEGRFLWLFESGYRDIYGPFASYMDQAAFCELAFPVALWRALEPGRRNRWPYTAAAAILVSAVVMSASRAGFLLLVAEAVAVVVLGGQRLPGWRARAGLALTGVAVAIFGMSAAAGWDRLLDRLQQEKPYEFRRNVLHSTIDMIRERPLAGFGLGNFATAYPAYARFDDGTRVNRAHNEWAEWWAEGGLPVFAGMAVIAAMLIRPAVGSVWGIGVLAVLLHGLIDYPLRRFGVAGWFLFVAAILDPVVGRNLRPERRREEAVVA